MTPKDAFKILQGNLDRIDELPPEVLELANSLYHGEAVRVAQQLRIEDRGSVSGYTIADADGNIICTRRIETPDETDEEIYQRIVVRRQ